MSPPFPADRFEKTLRRLASDNEHERAVAAKHASAMLREANLDWKDVLRSDLFALTPRRSDNPLSDIFGDIFSDLFRQAGSREKPAASPAAPPPAQPPTPSPTVRGFGFGRAKAPLGTPNAATYPVVQGKDIPRQVEGRVIIQGKNDLGQGKRMLIVQIADDTHQRLYAPLVVFRATTIARLEALAQTQETVRGHVRHPTAPTHLPMFEPTVS
jgi:hypothetical protein